MTPSTPNGSTKDTLRTYVLMRYNQRPLLTDSVFWKSLHAAKEDVDLCLEFRANHRVLWKAGDSLRNIGDIISSIKKRSHKDRIREGIWSYMPSAYQILHIVMEKQRVTSPPFKGYSKHKKPANYVTYKMNLEPICQLTALALELSYSSW